MTNHVGAKEVRRGPRRRPAPLPAAGEGAGGVPADRRSSAGTSPSRFLLGLTGTEGSGLPGGQGSGRVWEPATAPPRRVGNSARAGAEVCSRRGVGRANGTTGRDGGGDRG